MNDNTRLKHKERTLTSILSCVQKQTLGIKHEPLIRIEPNKIIIDELHLMLQISDILIRNLVYAAVSADSNAIKDSTTHIDHLVEKIRNIGITFRIWKSRESNGELLWTSLTGADRKKLLLRLPPCIPDIIPGVSGLKIKALWMDFNEIYHCINSPNAGAQ